MNDPLSVLVAPRPTEGQAQLDLGAPQVRGHAQLTNMRLALSTYLDCQDAGEGSPRFGLFYGRSGLGKSVGGAVVAARTGAAYIEAKSVWTQRSILEAIANELGITHLRRSAPQILDQVIDQLNREPRGILLDEMDYLVKKHFVEIIRDIHDSTRVPILMIGEEALPAKLMEWERFHNRILVATAAQPASVEDAKKLREHYCRRVQIADDLIERMTAACRGVTRRIVTSLYNAQSTAMMEGVLSIDAAWWGDRPFSTIEPPIRRRAA